MIANVTLAYESNSASNLYWEEYIINYCLCIGCSSFYLS